MANWKHRVDIADEWELAQNGEITVNQLAGVIADKLALLLPWEGDGRGELIHMFRHFAARNDDNRDEFDELMDMLYDWGDETLSEGQWPPDKRCWIGTF